MENIDLLLDLALAMGAALLGGAVAHFFRQPVILGYLLAGILIGPYTPGAVSNLERVQTLANLGVALLMFALGTEFSLETLGRVRRVAVGGGLAQIGLSILLGTTLGLVLGYPLTASIFLGGIIAISSSILMLKLLIGRDETESVTGRVALGTGIVQDLSIVALIIVLPALGEGSSGWELASAVGLAMLKGGLFLVVAFLLGTRLVPPLLATVARFGSRELFLLTIVAIATVTAVLGHAVGISFALGAFIGGLVVSESEFSSHVIDEIIPVRDIFATLFFVSIGMLLDPAFVFAHAAEVGLIVVAIMAGKLVICALTIRLFGYPRDVAVRAGLLLAQIGEFSFVLAGVGVARGSISEELYRLVLASALVSLILSPVLVNNADRLIIALRGVLGTLGRALPLRLRSSSPSDARAVAEVESLADKLAKIKKHVIICGYGRVGHEVARALARRGFPFVVVDYNQSKVEDARREGFLAIQGDATNPQVLERAAWRSARLLAITLPDLPGAQQIVRAARAANPDLRILVRAHDTRSIERLKEDGADEVIQPEFEAGMEIVRQSLRAFGVSSLETQTILGGRRREHYTDSKEAPLGEDAF